MSLLVQPRTAAELTAASQSVSIKNTITQGLLRLGSVPLGAFTDPATDFDSFQPAKPPTDGSDDKSSDISVVGAVAKLNKAAQKTFGSIGESLKWEFLEEYGPLRKRCVLDITRPDGLRRVYTTKSEFARKGEAKMKAASIAIENGAIDFIIYGEEPKGKGYTLAHVNTPPRIASPLIPTVEDVKLPPEITLPPSLAHLDPNRQTTQDSDLSGAIGEIERCCQTWRAGRISPQWVYTADPKTQKNGCAMKIALTPHLSRVYSVPTDFKTPEEAQKAAADVAISQDVIEFIQHGGGQIEPMPSAAEYALPIDLVEPAAEPLPKRKEKNSQDILATKVMNLQTFWDALPKPLPEEKVGITGGDETNPVAWINQTLQQYKGSQLFMSFTWTMDPKLGLHGCVMRLDHPSRDSRSYLVDPVFTKRQDAKTAVCLESISQRVGDWIRSIGSKYDDKLTKEMKIRAKDVLFGAITQDLQRLKPSQKANWTFENHKGVFGCKLIITVPTDEGLVEKSYATPMEYRNRQDAKAAVAILAVDQGILEFIRFQGMTPPADYNRETFDWKQHTSKKSDNKVRSESIKKSGDNQVLESGEIPPTPVIAGSSALKKKNLKKRKFSDDASSDDTPKFETKAEALARNRQQPNKRFNGNNHNNRPFRAGLSSANGKPLGVRHPETYTDWRTRDDGPGPSFMAQRGSEPRVMYPDRGFRPDERDPSHRFAGWQPPHDSPNRAPESHIPFSGIGFDGIRSNELPLGDRAPPRTTPRLADVARPNDSLISRPVNSPVTRDRHPATIPTGPAAEREGRIEPYPPRRREPVPYPPGPAYVDINRTPSPYYAHPSFPPPPPPPPPVHPGERLDPYYGRPEYYVPEGYYAVDPRWPRPPEPYGRDERDYPYPYPPYRDVYAPSGHPDYRPGPYPPPPIERLADQRGDPRASMPDSLAYRDRVRFPPEVMFNPPPPRGDVYAPRPLSPSIVEAREPGRTDSRPGLNQLRKRPASVADTVMTSTAGTFQSRQRGRPNKRARTDGPPVFTTDASNSRAPPTGPRNRIGAGPSDSTESSSSPPDQRPEPPRGPRKFSGPPPSKTPTKPYLTQLLEFCNKADIPPPTFRQNRVTTASGSIEYSVWIVMGKERLELPTTFQSLSTGQELLSKQVLARLRQSKTEGKTASAPAHVGAVGDDFEEGAVVD